jgi:hypothetical protein
MFDLTCVLSSAWFRANPILCISRDCLGCNALGAIANLELSRSSKLAFGQFPLVLDLWGLGVNHSYLAARRTAP